MKIALLCVSVAFALCLAAPLVLDAQRPPEVRRIGYLHADLGGLPSGFYEVLREGLRELGYVEGRNLIIEYRSSDDRARLAELAAELVRLNVEVIVTPGAATHAAQRAPETVPIVFSYSGDPIEPGSSRVLGTPAGT
jgi:putative tryptophan/tyrosine transport system substrate-binding protein